MSKQKEQAIRERDYAIWEEEGRYWPPRRRWDQHGDRRRRRSAGSQSPGSQCNL